MNYLRKYISQYAGLFCCAIFFLSLEAVCDLMQPTLMSKIVDVGIRNQNLRYVLTTGGIMLLVTAFGAFNAVMRNNISSRVSQRFGTGLRFDLFSRIQSLSFENIGHFETASLVTRLTNDVTQMQNFVNGMMRIFVKAPLLCVGSIVMAFLLDPHDSVILAVVVPLIALIILLNTRVGYPVFRRVQRAIDRVNGVMREYLSGVRVVKAFNRSDFEESRFSGANESLAGIQTSAMKVMAVFSPATTLIVDLGIVVVLWMGGVSVDQGSVQVGKIIALINYMAQISTSLMTISMVFTMFVRARASAERIGEVMDERPAVSSPVKPAAMGEKTEVEFADVGFSYGGAAEEVLRHVSFSCRAGETFGIIGTTGSGKTSLVNLIPRFYDATSGCVRVGGEDVRRLDLHALREIIAVVPQKTTLFTGTIRDNIRWGRGEASIGEIVEAARIAQADDFITGLPEGYDTVLGQGGVNLSGGQKQRIAIARALIRRPRILILDDCVSAVDVLTESKIRSGLRTYSEDLCCILIAQRISSVRAADRILVLDNGEIVGDGTHAQLLQSCAVYRDIYRSQFGEAV